MLNYLTLDTVFRTTFIAKAFSLPLAQLTGNNFVPHLPTIQEWPSLAFLEEALRKHSR